MAGIPPDAWHLVLSAGGKDALMKLDVLAMPADSTSHALTALAEVWQDFEEKYRRAVAVCQRLHLPLTLCTIYNGCFPTPLSSGSPPLL